MESASVLMERPGDSIAVLAKGIDDVQDFFDERELVDRQEFMAVNIRDELDGIHLDFLDERAGLAHETINGRHDEGFGDSI